jgi:hypothetical protein
MEVALGLHSLKVPERKTPFAAGARQVNVTARDESFVVAGI